MFNRLNLGTKLTAIVLVLSIPLLVLVSIEIVGDVTEIRQTDREVRTLDYLSAIRQFLEIVPQHRGTSQGYIFGDTGQKGRVDALRTEADDRFAALKAVDAGDPALGATGRLEALETNWDQVKQLPLQLDRSSFERHTRLIAEVEDFMEYVADRGLLLSDSEVGPASLIDSLVRRIPSIAEDMGVLRGLGNGVAAAAQATGELPSNAERIRLAELAARIEVEESSINNDYLILFQRNAEVEADLSPLLTEATRSVETFLSRARNDLLNADAITIEPTVYFDTGTRAIDRYFALFDQSLVDLELLFQDRRQGLLQRLALRGGVSILLFLLAVYLSYRIRGGIVRQVNAMTSVFGMVGIGDFDARAAIYSQDELGNLALNLNAMLDSIRGLIQSQAERDSIQQSIQKLLEEVSTVADGDLTAEAEVTADLTGAIADSFNFMITELRGLIFEVRDTTLQVSSAANEVQATAEHLAEGSTSQKDQIVNTGAAVDEMAVSIQQVSQNAESAAGVATQALDQARQGASSVTETIEGMNRIRRQVQETSKRIKRLGESSQEIGEIIQLISDIADRTSILALNASIQAAMAGEAGRGFAVVAEEVERLAENSAEATKRVSTLVKSIQTDTNDASQAMELTTREVVVGSEVANKAGESLGAIEQVSQSLAELISSISMAATQQARSSESVARSMHDISEVTVQTAAGTRQAAVSLRNLGELADTLRNSLDRFKLPQNV